MNLYLRAGLLAASALLPLVLEGDTRGRKNPLRLGGLSLFLKRRGEDYGVEVQAGERSHFFPLRALKRPSPKALLKFILEERELLLDLLFLSIYGWRGLRRCPPARAEVQIAIWGPPLVRALYGWLSTLPKGIRAEVRVPLLNATRGRAVATVMEKMPDLMGRAMGQIGPLVDRFRKRGER